MMGYGYYYGNQSFLGGSMHNPLLMIFWWIFVIFAAIVLIKWLSGGSKNIWHHEKSPLDILKERYAKGEIERKEFEEKKKDLSS